MLSLTTLIGPGQGDQSLSRLSVEAAGKRLPLIQNFLSLNVWYLFSNKMSIPYGGTSCRPGMVSIITGYMYSV